ncbi:hypothetical protein [Butyricicoccus pullicaecorum]|uniref:hypothetical protein n=1 Tax=Butyricicoccus pullicaecorum TaxID=501571 RepID=UPI001177B9C2|nr:hypothetical protein [Butyricicoccus pullicaecorum]
MEKKYGGIPARRRIEAFAQAFLERLAGSQGSALSRHPQMAKSLFDFRFCENQLKKNKKARPQTRNSLERPSAWDGLSFLYVLIETRGGHRVSKGDSVSCGTRLRALP